MPSFDVVCELDLQEVDNAIHQTQRELGTRFDFKGTTFEVRREDHMIHLHAQDEFLHLGEDQAGGTIIAQRFSGT